MITITLNGKKREVDAPKPVPEFLQALDISQKQVAVAINGEVVRRDMWPRVVINDGDVVEVVRAVGGG